MADLDTDTDDVAEDPANVPDVAAIAAKYQARLEAAVQAEVTEQAMPVAQPPVVPGSPPAPVIPAAPAAPVAAVPPPIQAEETPRAKTLAALARKEAELREWEGRLKAQEAPAAPKPSSLEDLASLARSDRKSFLKQFGIDDPTAFAADLMLEDLGADAPADLKQGLQTRRDQAELKATQARIAEIERMAKEAPVKAMQAARVEATDRELSAFAHSVPAELTYLAGFAKENPQEVYESLCHVAAAHIQAGKFISATEAGRLVEAQLKTEHERFQRIAQPPAPATPAPTAPTGPTRTPALSDTEVRGRADRGQSSEAKDREYYIQRALQVAAAHGLR